MTKLKADHFLLITTKQNIQLLLIVLISLTSLKSAFSQKNEQLSIGTIGGVEFSNNKLINSYPEIKTYINKSQVINESAGILISYLFKENYRLHLDILYAKKRFIRDYMVIESFPPGTPREYPYVDKVLYNASYIIAPLSFDYVFLNERAINTFIGAGVALGIYITENQVAVYEDNTVISSNEWMPSFSHITFDPSAKMGVSLKLGNKLMVALDNRLAYPLVRLSNIIERNTIAVYTYVQASYSFKV